MEGMTQLVRSRILNSSLYEYSNAYIHAKGTKILLNTEITAAPNIGNKKVIFESCAPLTHSISEINNKQVDNAIEVVMPMNNLIDYSDIYSKISWSSWQYYRDEPGLDNNNNIVDSPAINNSISFKFKEKVAGGTGKNSRKDTEIMVPLKYLSNFWRTLEIPLMNCEISLILTWSANCFLLAVTVANQVPTFEITFALCPGCNFINSRWWKTITTTEITF